MTKKLHLLQGRGRVQFLACKDEIFDLIEKGYSIANIHEILKENNKVTVSYQTLLRLIRGKIINTPAYEFNECIEENNHF